MQKPLVKTMNRIAFWVFVLLCLSMQTAIAAPGYQAPSVQPMATSVTNPSTLSDVYQLNSQEKVKFPHYLGAYYQTVRYEKGSDAHQPTEGTQNSQVNLGSGHDYKMQVAPASKPTRVEAAGYIRPDGQYMWDGRIGWVPNPTLTMPGFDTPLNVSDSGYIGPTQTMISSVNPAGMNIRTTSITNAEFGILMANAAQLRNELRAQPDRWKEAMRAAQETKQSSQSNTTAESAENNENTGWDNAIIPLINVANENAWVPCSSDQPFKSYANAAWMVGQMYKQVYIPMAILLLLPGAVLTQVKIIVRTGFVPDPTGYDDDLFSPFSGILRSIIAVFLIPATQLFVSYTIDVGNSLTYEVRNYRLFDMNIVKQWRNQQTFNTSPQNDMNHIENTKQPGAGTVSQDQGKALSMDENNVQFNHQPYVSSTGQQWFNTIDNLLAQGMVCLNAFQVVMIMYLFLLGPVAAAMYAWPGVGGDIFRRVYSNWMDGVVLVTLWKFWWCVVILCMSIRLQAYQDTYGTMPPTDSTFEQFMCAAFTAILMYVPFNPFDFRPGDLVDSVLQQAQSQTSKGGSGGAVGGSASPAGGSTTTAGSSAGGGNTPAG